MKGFYAALSRVNKMMYAPNGLTVKSAREEKQNMKYGAGAFECSSKSIRFRVANVTPNKVGQFVSIWEKDSSNKNQPYSYDESTDLLVITTFKNDVEYGQFIFPKEVLLKQKILKSSSTKGKMAMRVYPIWDTPTSKQAMKSQQWQLPYFIDMSHQDHSNKQKIIKLYTL